LAQAVLAQVRPIKKTTATIRCFQQLHQQAAVLAVVLMTHQYQTETMAVQVAVLEFISQVLQVQQAPQGKVLGVVLVHLAAI
jgi:hypothetical protein